MYFLPSEEVPAALSVAAASDVCAASEDDAFVVLPVFVVLFPHAASEAAMAAVITTDKIFL